MCAMEAFLRQLDYFSIDRQNLVSRDRILSVDVLRGFDMIWIIGVKKIFKGLDDVCDTPLTNWIFSQLDHAEWTTFFVVVGSNAIAAYVSASIFDYRLIAKVFVGGLEKYVGPWYPFLLAFGGFMVLYLILDYLHRNKIFIKI